MRHKYETYDCRLPQHKWQTNSNVGLQKVKLKSLC